MIIGVFILMKIDVRLMRKNNNNNVENDFLVLKVFLNVLVDLMIK